MTSTDGLGSLPSTGRRTSGYAIPGTVPSPCVDCPHCSAGAFHLRSRRGNRAIEPEMAYVLAGPVPDLVSRVVEHGALAIRRCDPAAALSRTGKAVPYFYNCHPMAITQCEKM